MPVSFQFVAKDAEKEVATPLARIDDEVCAEAGYPPHAENFSPEYNSIVNAGISMLLRYNACVVTKEIFDKFIVDISMDKASIPFYRKFLLEDYVFHAWR